MNYMQDALSGSGGHLVRLSRKPEAVSPRA